MRGPRPPQKKAQPSPINAKGRVQFTPPTDRNELTRSNLELQNRYNTALDALDTAEQNNTALFGAYQNTLLILACVMHDIATKCGKLPEIKYEFPRASMDAVVLKAINARFEQFDRDGNPITETHKVEMDHTIVEITLKDGELEKVVHNAQDQMEQSKIIDPNTNLPADARRHPKIMVPQ